MALPAFKDEADFRENWIAPFLSKRGYILVNHSHGAGEQGKDFFFADYDRFEHRRFYAVQAKIGNIGAGKSELDLLLNQVARAFKVRLRFHKEASEKRVSAVYLMTNGTISDLARESISEWCQLEKFGENVYYLDGDTLDRLDKFVFQRTDRELRNIFIGVLNECDHNSTVIQLVQKVLADKKMIFDRCRHFAIEQLLSSPPLKDILDIKIADDAWKQLTLLNKICDYHLLPFRTSDEEWQRRIAIATRTWDANLRLRDAAFDAIRTIDGRYSVAADLVE